MYPFVRLSGFDVSLSISSFRFPKIPIGTDAARSDLLLFWWELHNVAEAWCRQGGDSREYANSGPGA